MTSHPKEATTLPSLSTETSVQLNNTSGSKSNSGTTSPSSTSSLVSSSKSSTAVHRHKFNHDRNRNRNHNLVAYTQPAPQQYTLPPRTIDPRSPPFTVDPNTASTSAPAGSYSHPPPTITYQTFHRDVYADVQRDRSCFADMARIKMSGKGGKEGGDGKGVSGSVNGTGWELW